MIQQPQKSIFGNIKLAKTQGSFKEEESIKHAATQEVVVNEELSKQQKSQKQSEQHSRQNSAAINQQAVEQEQRKKVKVDPIEKSKAAFYATTPPPSSAYLQSRNSQRPSSGFQENAARFFIGSRGNSASPDKAQFQKDLEKFYQKQPNSQYQADYKSTQQRIKTPLPRQTYSALQKDPEYQLNQYKFYSTGPVTPGLEKLQMKRDQNVFYENSGTKGTFNLVQKQKEIQPPKSMGSDFQRNNHKFWGYSRGNIASSGSFHVNVKKFYS